MSTERVMAADDDTARRLVRLREAMGYGDRGGQTRIAKELGISLTRWNNFEQGMHLSHEVAVKLCIKFGVTLDWLYLGAADGLSINTARLLGEAPDPSGRSTSRKTRPPKP